MIALFLVVAITVLISTHCSLFEAVLYSTRRAELEAAISTGRHPGLARKLLTMKDMLAAPLASILILNTVANTAGAALAGSLAREALGPGQVLWFSLGLTVIILLFSEILPKTVGGMHWRFLWPFIVMPLRVMNWALYPGVRFSLWITRKLMGTKRAVSVTEEEILAMVRMGARAGQISDMESKMVGNIIGLEEKTARDVMTPRTVIFALDEDLSVEEAYDQAYPRGFNRIPVYHGSAENIRGYVLMKELSARETWDRPEAPIKSLVTPISFVPETANCLVLLRRFLKDREHLAMVVDEYGGISGLLTLEDLIETIIGHEIVDETDAVVDMREHARRKRELEAMEKNNG